MTMHDIYYAPSILDNAPTTNADITQSSEVTGQGHPNHSLGLEEISSLTVDMSEPREPLANHSNTAGLDGQSETMQHSTNSSAQYGTIEPVRGHPSSTAPVLIKPKEKVIDH